MNTQELSGMWNHLRMCHGIARRAVAAIPADKIHSRPIPSMRTPVELVVHTYATAVREMAEGVARGEITEPDEVGMVARIETREDLLALVDESWAAATRAVSSITDAQLKAIVKTYWDANGAPGYRYFGALQDEFLHHRGQLYVYLRALGQEPPMVWDFENNASEFRPQSHATA
ncbi:MAG: hypothetical protein E6K78_05015 [Candidatus Eisenbacteria bacterium]|uniref:DinB-like domain-containing protein n=1 Tax=Eiseniibacteriota bacterium TaxID=2212470 RepID=A0A538TV09_UNCEI|nr:MAG: hypothetical protein E6K78_05015 [Candidatus Eisenbacteria bacterium]